MCRGSAHGPEVTRFQGFASESRFRGDARRPCLRLGKRVDGNILPPASLPDSQTRTLLRFPPRRDHPHQRGRSEQGSSRSIGGIPSTLPDSLRTPLFSPVCRNRNRSAGVYIVPVAHHKRCGGSPCRIRHREPPRPLLDGGSCPLSRGPAPPHKGYSPRPLTTSLKLPAGMRGMRRKPAVPYLYGANCPSAAGRSCMVPSAVRPTIHSPSHSQSATSARI
jgi:hypothetical protein